MLTALPAESARKFLEDVTKGDVFSALWSLTRSLGDLAAAFHRGAGVYRAGIENVAASTPSCDQKEPLARRFRDYHQDRDTVLVAAACLGLSNETLFDSETISADQLPSQVAPAAFLALFRIVRIACVALPLQNLASDPNNQIAEERKERADSCDLLRFDPKPRPDTIVIDTSRDESRSSEGSGQETPTHDGAESQQQKETPAPVKAPIG